MTKQATIQRILDLQPIPEADKIEVASVLGWKVVVEKGLYKVGDLCIYCEIDSFLPVRPEFEFLRKSSFKVMNNEEGFRIKTCKLKKQLSQGLCLPISILELTTYEENGKKYYGVKTKMTSCEGETLYLDLEEGTDVSEFLNIKHYEKPIPVNMAGIIKGNFPGFIFKTDEVRIQSEPELLEQLKEKPYYITVKCDGTSFTAYYKDGNLGVCSRNLELKEDENNAYWKVAKKYDLLNVLGNYENGYLAIQGELCGPGVQRNPMQLKEIDLFVFNIFSITEGRYFNYIEMKNFCKDHNLKMVPKIEFGSSFNYTQEQLLEMAKGKYEGTQNNREGIVVRSLGKDISFKVLNNDFLLKDEE